MAQQPGSLVGPAVVLTNNLAKTAFLQKIRQTYKYACKAHSLPDVAQKLFVFIFALALLLLSVRNCYSRQPDHVRDHEPRTLAAAEGRPWRVECPDSSAGAGKQHA